MKKKENERKLNNSGFSLVELIIVIAIMAVLVGVAAPTYIKYVERSRESLDIQNIDSIVTALKIYAVDPQSVEKFRTNDKVFITEDGTSATSPSGSKAAANAITSSGLQSVKSNSEKYKNVTLTITVEASGELMISANVDGLGLPVK